jgi:hypothetical protein
VYGRRNRRRLNIGTPPVHFSYILVVEVIYKLAAAIHFGVYNFVRKHHTLGTTPAVAAGIEENGGV